MILITYFSFETQIIFMRFLKYFKINEILHVDTFDIICTSQTYNIIKFQ
jgi:hypothetical protein